jgi:inhibitor of cysteine peptidase
LKSHISAALLVGGLAIPAAAFGDDPAGGAGGRGGDKDSAGPDTGTVTVTFTSRDDPAKPAKATVRRGGLLVVRLEARPGTGFGWTQSAGADSAALKPEGETFFESDKTLPGGTEWQVFRYRAVAAGTANLEFRYARPFEKDMPPAKVFRATVEVQ